MVHLGRVQTDKDLSQSVIPGLDKLDLSNPAADEFTSSVYGSRFASTDIPKHEMPDEEMPKEIAYRLIKYGDGMILIQREGWLTVVEGTISRSMATRR